MARRRSRGAGGEVDTEGGDLDKVLERSIGKQFLCLKV